MTRPLTRASARQAARNAGEKHMRLHGRSSLNDADRDVGKRALRRFKLIMSEHDGGYYGMSEYFITESEYGPSYTLREYSDAAFGIVEAEYLDAMSVTPEKAEQAA